MAWPSLPHGWRNMLLTQGAPVGDPQGAEPTGLPPSLPLSFPRLGRCLGREIPF